MKIDMKRFCLFCIVCFVVALGWAAEDKSMIQEKFNKQNDKVEAPQDGGEEAKPIHPLARLAGKGNPQNGGGAPGGGAPKKVFFWGITEDVLLGILAMPVAALLAAFLAYHPMRMRKTGVKKDERDVPKALILLSVGGAVVCSLIYIKEIMAMALFGFGSFIRFRTPVKNPKETVVIFLCAMTGCFCGLHQFHLAVAMTLFVWILIWFLERGVGGEMERATVILKGLGTESQVAMKEYKENLEKAGIEVVSSKVSLRKGHVTILLNKQVSQPVEDLEAVILAGTSVMQPKSVEWIRE